MVDLRQAIQSVVRECFLQIAPIIFPAGQANRPRIKAIGLLLEVAGIPNVHRYTALPIHPRCDYAVSTEIGITYKTIAILIFDKLAPLGNAIVGEVLCKETIALTAKRRRPVGHDIGISKRQGRLRRSSRLAINLRQQANRCLPMCQHIGVKFLGGAIHDILDGDSFEKQISRQRDTGMVSRREIGS